jgi:RNA polymerase sigma-70 factor (ECF subfamily)
MSETSRENLRHFLVLGYADLKTRLARYLGSVELADDALQETYLRLARGPDLAPVLKPRPYLLRMAARIAVRNRRGRRDIVSLDDAKAAFDVADAAPDPQRTLEARDELETFRRAAAELTPRRRAILYASRIEGLPLRKIAARLNVSQRLVETELKHALAHCALRLNREIVQRFGPSPRDASTKQEADKDED